MEQAPDRDGARVHRLAHHFSNAVGMGLEERAAVYLKQAALAAQARLANADSAELFEQAASFAADPTERDCLLLRAARCHHVTGHVTRAKALDERVATEGVADLRLAAAVGYESSCWRSGADWEHAVRLLTAGLEAGPQDRTAERIRAAGHLARALATAGRLDDAVATSTEALAAARATGDPHTLLAVLATEVHTTTGLQRPTERWQSARELTELIDRLGNISRLGAASSARAQAAYTLGEAGDVHPALAALTRMVRDTQQPYWLWTSHLHETGMRILRCDFSGAERSLREGRLAVRAFESDAVTEHDEGPSSLQAFVLRRETGGLEPARALIAAGVDLHNPWRPGVVALGTELRIASMTLPALREAVTHELDQFRNSSSWPAVLSFLGEAAAWLHEQAAAEILLAEAEPHSGLNLLGGEFLAPLGSIHRLIGELRSALDRPDAEEHYAVAVEMDQRMGSTLHVATTQAQWAAHLMRSHAPRARVEEHARVARDLAHQYGLVRVRQLLGDAAAGPQTPLPGGLTRREVEVLRLIERGCSNRDIAVELVISEHTAANHVRSILMKTQSTNRTAAVHYATRHGLLRSSDGGDE